HERVLSLVNTLSPRNFVPTLMSCRCQAKRQLSTHAGIARLHVVTYPGQREPLRFSARPLGLAFCPVGGGAGGAVQPVRSGERWPGRPPAESFPRTWRAGRLPMGPVPTP